jgi:hypothetical protein
LDQGSCTRRNKGVKQGIPIGVRCKIWTIALIVELVAGTITIPLWDVLTATIVNGARTVAHAAQIIDAITVVDIVANAISVRIRHVNTWIIRVANAIAICVGNTIPTTNTKHVHLISATIAIAFRDACATAFVHRAGTVADATLVRFADAKVSVVTNPISIGILRASASAHAQSVKTISLTVAFPLWNVAAPTIVQGARHDAFVLVQDI